ncbi:MULTISPECIES: hypothetical protein [unclassified Colwellia]|uniref:hypothetical protein n=1 Tax=unclassified Colwellia TaxID=196834 RepID=UPI0015F631A0|nr:MULTISPECIES: hypothetical protein [unclassified Colwellia]MBA6378764.1 hypothetical protein [Colwellia sp. BRX10-7]MBA6386901.1 hypothetical protein [Colwellia sp. BRX10-2]MBA6401334.1 hypothetical protein [Colwellia sp. BRX10-5]MBA6404432.1 hypothetical protein [Colwellia sp. BRX10-1]
MDMVQDDQKIIRGVFIVTVGELHQDFLHPEKICIKNPKDGLAPLDVGSFAYTDREECLKGIAQSYKSEEYQKTIKVKESSLSTDRR